MIVQDVEVAQKVQGKNIASLKGNTTWRNPNIVVWDQVNIPVGLIRLHKEVLLTHGIFFVKKIPLFLTLIHKIYFTAVNHPENHTVPEIFKSFKEVYQYYIHRGFHITKVHADGKLGPLNILIESLPGGPLVNMAADNEHVPEIKRQIRVVKEWCIATCHGINFQRIPQLLNTHIVLNTVKMLKVFPTKGGISEILSPKIIISGETLDFKKHLRL